MAFKNTNLSVLAYNTGYILRRNQLISRILSQSSGTRFTPGNGYTYEIFINPGSFTVHTGGYVDLMLIGGGGGGGCGNPPNASAGGGGGAGGMLHVYNQLFPQGTYEVRIGNGGPGGVFAPSTVSSPFNRGGDGKPTHITGSVGFSSITASGGGGGGAGYYPLPPDPPEYYGQPGGSGGGAGGGTPYTHYGEGISGQGYPGGLGRSSPPIVAGGGGGGASESGYTYTPAPTSNKGGDGASAFSGDPGIPSAYGTPGPGTGRYFSGGGTGGFGSAPLPVGGGGAWNPSAPRENGLINTGGGGAGNNLVGYSGGPGIVIIRYLTGAS